MVFNFVPLSILALNNSQRNLLGHKRKANHLEPPTVLPGRVVKGFEFVLFPGQIADELIKYQDSAWTDL